MQCHKNSKIKDNPHVTTAHFYGSASLGSESIKHHLSLKLHSTVIPNLKNGIYNVRPMHNTQGYFGTFTKLLTFLALKHCSSYPMILLRLKYHVFCTSLTYDTFVKWNRKKKRMLEFPHKLDVTCICKYQPLQYQVQHTKKYNNKKVVLIIKIPNS